ncbi:hypothetical protein Tco_0273376 [Tanacetum coccineum]
MLKRGGGGSSNRGGNPKIDKDPTISLVQPEQDMEYDFDVSTAKRLTTSSVPVTTASASISIASASISTASATPEVSIAAANLVYIRRSAEKRKDKGKDIMKEDESGLEVGLIRRIQGIGYDILELLGVGITFDIFQQGYVVSSWMDMAYWSSE